MKKIYVVCEDLTNEFYDLFTEFGSAQKKAKEIGGYVLECKIDENFNIVEKNWEY